jgi:hypothetical protein
MKLNVQAFTVLAILMLALVPLTAGCLSIPGPESAKKTTPAVTMTTRSPSPAAPAAVTTLQTGAFTATPTPLPATTQVSSGYASVDCTGLGGWVVSPGQQCKGTWLTATNTFSCCSVQPVKAGIRNHSFAVSSLNLSVNLADSLGSISP